MFSGGKKAEIWAYGYNFYMFSGGLKAEIWVYGYNFYMFSGRLNAEIWGCIYNFYMFTRGKRLRYGPAATTSTCSRPDKKT
jgi:hypothetical protein